MTDRFDNHDFSQGYTNDTGNFAGQPEWRGYGRFGNYEEPDWRGYDYQFDYRFNNNRPSPAGGNSGAAPWKTPGPFTGRGPKNYRRSDDRIREDVCQMLTQHGWLDATDIDVTVDNGVVSLQGQVDAR